MRLQRNFVWDTLLAATLLLIVGYCHAISHMDSPMLLLSTLMLTAMVIIHWLLHVRERVPSLANSSVLLFETLFLVVAPSVQRAYYEWHMVNTATLEESLAVSTNLLCTLFVMTYVATRYYMQRRDQHRSRTRRPRPPTFVRTLRLNAPRTFVLLGVAAVAAMLSWQTIDLRAQSEVIEATPQYLLVQKYLCFMPVPMLLMLVNVKGRKLLRQPFWLLVTLFVLACVLITQNPLIEKRNAIGPIYLSLLLMLMPWFSRTPRRLVSTLVLLTGVFFPLLSIFTHTDLSAWQPSEILDPWLYFSHFLDLHYDAWANIATVIEMVNRDGLSYGHQLAGSLLFFVPHTLWETKPLATGIEIGQFLMAYYKLDFDNLSAPLIAEAYIDFFAFGVIAYAIALAFIVRLLDKLCRSGGIMALPAGIYFSIFLIFALRGALMIAMAYGSGALMAFLTIGWFVSGKRRLHTRRSRNVRPLGPTPVRPAI
ncbi:hypothetical protein ACUXAV_004102 [Cupriavidus metallidurans]|jgi:hypothetical protein|uniref:hypothetical protein n=1 Tax=Cupriavidus TaxID=106589 RepID=UPI000493B4AF|nr:hypothetical protein [Cupriavidus metallidurans]AVA35374.1 hypothetical protein C3Z06_18340 [Cupriavidus metallidurans]KWW33158.1 hypothetical protein AU374_05527 [Cupriavidus metallidurans]MDE4921014.1 hypothetical protein [Cupriavidus metallidurans]